MPGILTYLWRLFPGNPILLRVVAMGSKRTRDLIIRCIYLGALVVIVLVSLAGVGSSAGNDLAKLSDASTKIFQTLSYLQLAFVALLAPIFTAGAISQEKDSQTYDVLLATPLTNAQIVFGSLFSRLFFVFALLLSGVPIFSITQIFGGVAFGDVVQSVTIALVTALFTGSLAVAIATFKIGTRQTIFSFYLFNIAYLVGLYLLAQLPQMRIPRVGPDGGPIGGLGGPSNISWLAAFHPLLALQVVLEPLKFTPPTASQLSPTLSRWPISWALTNPVGFFISLSTFLSIILVLPSVVLLRRIAQSSTTFINGIFRKLKIAKNSSTRTPREVWNNPIAWREGSTNASAARSVFIRYGFILIGIAAAGMLIVAHSTEAGTPARFIDAGSFDPLNNTLLLRGTGGTTLMVDDATSVRILRDEFDANGNRLWQAAGRGELNRRFEIANVATQTRGTVQYARSIDLTEIPRQVSTTSARRFLLGLVLLQAVAILLIITNAAASTVTREKEDGTLDLLLCTPITSRYYMWGKVRGLISYVLPLIVVPVASCGLFIAMDALRFIKSEITGNDFVVRPEAIILLPPLLIVVAAFAAITGIYLSLALRTTVLAVMSSVGIVLGVCGGLAWCGWGMLGNSSNPIALALGSFSPFTVISMLIAPESLNTALINPPESAAMRGTIFVTTAVAIAAYAGGLYYAYISMVKNFDMTIRKQSR